MESQEWRCEVCTRCQMVVVQTDVEEYREDEDKLQAWRLESMMKWEQQQQQQQSGANLHQMYTMSTIGVRVAEWCCLLQQVGKVRPPRSGIESYPLCTLSREKPPSFPFNFTVMLVRNYIVYERGNYVIRASPLSLHLHSKFALQYPYWRCICREAAHSLT